MDVVVKIADRDALAVWTLPYVTSWRLSPDMLTKRLVDPTYDNTFPTAFNLNAHGIPSSLPPAQWYEINNLIIKIEQDLENKNLPEYDDRNEWITRSIKEFWRYELSYVWLDEFEKWYERFIHWSYVSEKDENTELVLNPMLPIEHAVHFENTELRKLKAKVPLDKLGKEFNELQDAWIIANGPPTVSLWEFIDRLLVESTGNNAPLPIFYSLVEVYGLVVYDKVIDGQVVLPHELLGALRKREQQADKSFDDDSFQFWETLAKESKYSISRDDVAKAYECAGKSKFPWLSWHDGLVSLNVEEHTNAAISGGFGLPAQPEDYQDAFKQDAWSWQEALCWLKGRLPDGCRLHQLPKYYSDEINLIQRAIKADPPRLTNDSSSPKQWINWAREKGWLIPPLISQCLFVDDLDETVTPKSIANHTGNDGGSLFEIENNDSIELILNGEPINWKYWASRLNFTHVEASRLAYCINPLRWKGNECAQGILKENVRSEIEQLEAWLGERSQFWTLKDLFAALGEDFAPLGMKHAVSGGAEPQTEAAGGNGAGCKATTGPTSTAKPRRKRKPVQKNTTEGLLLVDELLTFYKIAYLDELKGIKAWGLITSGAFSSDSIKLVSDSKKSITLANGEKIDKSDFLEKYRKRFSPE